MKANTSPSDTNDEAVRLIACSVQSEVESADYDIDKLIIDLNNVNNNLTPRG